MICWKLMKIWLLSIGNSMISSDIWDKYHGLSDISKLLYVISRAVRWVKFETILKYHESCYYLFILDYPKKVVIFTCRYFKLSWNTTALLKSQSNCRNFSCSSISHQILQTFVWCWAQTCSPPNNFVNFRNFAELYLRSL